MTTRWAHVLEVEQVMAGPTGPYSVVAHWPLTPDHIRSSKCWCRPVKPRNSAWLHYSNWLREIH